MRLYEFFGNPIEVDDDTMTSAKLIDDVFWFILDDTNLYKEHFIPIEHSMMKNKEENEWKKWAPLADAGWEKFYKKHDIKGSPNKIYKEVKDKLCKKLADYYRTDYSEDKKKEESGE